VVLTTLDYLYPSDEIRKTHRYQLEPTCPSLLKGEHGLWSANKPAEDADLCLAQFAIDAFATVQPQTVSTNLTGTMQEPSNSSPEPRQDGPCEREVNAIYFKPNPRTQRHPHPFAHL
jgi:hypothetical protein